ncbi:type IV pilus assembly protein PilX [Acidovorax delafieldii]|uniref:Type IV pilus assembly protein PilX n=1 Tax=Acidovorax delafieldii TaxID=47920 RepID=A0A561XKT8_ACIDE|nr:PilX N-terminal domain-containing pilus assembly protein [Acidovorax delafieldii]TWG36722.1 type IV pilus assembly protein PilX [Acidovorax delafieldii]
MMKIPLHQKRPASMSEQGLSLIIVMLILIVVSILGVGGIQISMMGERGTRNDRDMQIAWQGAEAGLIDAEFDIEGLPAASPNKRSVVFKRGDVDLAKFIDNCGDSGQSIGLCALKDAGKPAWLTVDFTATGTGAKAVELGTYTGRDFPSGVKGTQPAKPPRYIIEPILDRYGVKSYRTTDPTAGSGPSYVYRVTSMGFGPNGETQGVLQMIYRN